jgi:D-alanyl-D-alanine carboxypeptidase/D-alanyl-D-alanine-endopeptidase (penicillin-binding protein 4)
LAYSGYLEGKVLQGDLLLIGDGDPSLGSDRFGPERAADALLKRWTKAIANAGIERIEGRVLVSALAFDEPAVPPGWENQDLANYFGAPIAGLNWRENIYRLPIRTSAPGTVTMPGTPKPDQPDLQFTNLAPAGPVGSPDLGYLYQGPDGQQRILVGSLPPYKPGFAVKGAVPDPALSLARELEHALQKEGIHLSGAASSVHVWSAETDQALFGASTAKTVLDTLSSPSLSELVAKTNLLSLNLYAECILRWVGRKQKGQASTQAGTEAVFDYWQKKGMDTTGLFIQDGSGLSFSNGIAPKHLVFMLADMDETSPAGKVFRASLPVMGVSGTLQSLGHDTKALGRLCAKTGTLTRVLGYAGYATTATGIPIAFALLVNRYNGSFATMKRATEKLVVGLCD